MNSLFPLPSHYRHIFVILLSACYRLHILPRIIADLEQSLFCEATDQHRERRLGRLGRDSARLDRGSVAEDRSPPTGSIVSARPGACHGAPLTRFGGCRGPPPAALPENIRHAEVRVGLQGFRRPSPTEPAPPADPRVARLAPASPGLLGSSRVETSRGEERSVELVARVSCPDCKALGNPIRRARRVGKTARRRTKQRHHSSGDAQRAHLRSTRSPHNHSAHTRIPTHIHAQTP